MNELQYYMRLVRAAIELIEWEMDQGKPYRSILDKLDDSMMLRDKIEYLEIALGMRK